MTSRAIEMRKTILQNFLWFDIIVIKNIVILRKGIAEQKRQPVIYINYSQYSYDNGIVVIL